MLYKRNHFCIVLGLGFLFLTQTLYAQPTNRCGTQKHRKQYKFKVASDCGSNETVIRPDYEPNEVLTIRVVVHNIHNSSGTGKLAESVIIDQIQILNEDFGAMAGTSAESGTESGIRFVLATETPDGEPTNGINYVENDNWYQAELEDFGPTLHWDHTRYLNFYITDAQGYAGVVYQLPWEPNPVPGYEGFVVNYNYVGFSQIDGSPNHTATHEAGHYLGLEHTFNNLDGKDCPTGDCYTTGDYICDTNPHKLAEDPSCSNRTPCGKDEPIHNYMNYTPDRCMNQFTPEQINRMRCGILNYKTGILTEASSSVQVLPKRWIPHLTSQNGGFETEIFLTNTGSDTQKITLKGYNTQGESQDEQTFTLAAGQRQILSPDDVFSTSNPTHAAISGSDKIIVSYGYKVANQPGISAHLAEYGNPSQSFMLHLGEADYVFDGVAFINLGRSEANISAEALGAAGPSGQKSILAENLPRAGKALATLSDVMPFSTNGLIRITSDQPILVLGIRGSRPGAELPFLFYNPVIPFAP